MFARATPATVATFLRARTSPRDTQPSSATSTVTARYFRADSTSVPGQAPSEVPTVEAGMSSAGVEACAGYYNNADEVIGKNIKYIRVRFTAKEADK